MQGRQQQFQGQQQRYPQQQQPYQPRGQYNPQQSRGGDGRGYGGNRQMGSGGHHHGNQGHFSQKPVRSHYNTAGPIQLITNNFKIRSANKGIIYNYDVAFVPGDASNIVESPEDTPAPQKTVQQEETKEPSAKKTTLKGYDGLETFQKYKILSAHANILKNIFLHYVCVGNNLFSTTSSEELVQFETDKEYFGRKFVVMIERVSEFDLSDLNTMRMEDHPVALSFINSIIKTQMRNAKLCQIGRNPRFFVPSLAQTVDNVQTWPGYFTSSWIFQRGLYLIIDNISKNLSVDNCFTLIKEQLDRSYNKQRNQSGKLNDKVAQQAVNDEFHGNIVMARYGLFKTYKLNAIRWDMTPESCKFEHGDNGQTISMLEYFQQQYDKKIQNIRQPLFEIKQKRQNIYLPPELCTLVGIPQKVRENKKVMLQLRQSQCQRPHERIASIKDLNKMIAQSKEVQDWGLDLQLDPDTIEAKVLDKPSIWETPNFGAQTSKGSYDQKAASSQTPSAQQQKSRVLENSNLLNGLVHEPRALEKFAIFCVQRDAANAQYINDKLYELSTSKHLDIHVQFAEIITINDKALQYEDKLLAAFAGEIQAYYDNVVAKYLKAIAKDKPVKGRIPFQFVFMIIMPDKSNHQEFYRVIKNKINCDSPVISQFVANRTIIKDNDRIFLNIIRQMNAKIGGDLWRMNFGKEISSKTMLVGIDVCHKGRQSTIGFCATYDSNLCKYYAQASPQPKKGQEIISSKILTDYFSRSFKSYREYNDGNLPEHIFIYRDGVGDSMRQQVIDAELQQLNKIVAKEYGFDTEHAVKAPQIALIIVNKRVRQRFFRHDRNGISNPPAGTYVDQGFVEQAEVVNGKFDFFLIPHTVTQGSVKPTHFYVAENQSNISKEAILNFTYALCYNYYNWNDSIKIPAPVMLADKIAGFRSEVGTIPSNIDLHKLPFYL